MLGEVSRQKLSTVGSEIKIDFKQVLQKKAKLANETETGRL